MKKQTLLFAFLFLLCLAVFRLDAFAQTSYAIVSGDRFLCRSFSSENASLTTGEDGALEMSFRRVAPSVSADMEIGTRELPANAIRIVLINNSSCNSFVFTYQYLDEMGVNQTASEKITLASRGVRTDYYVYTDMADRVTHISLAFSGIASGTVIISSVDVFSLCDEPDTAFGTLTECLYDRQENRIRVRGSIRYDLMIQNRKARIALYAVGFDQTDIPPGTTPLATAAMSSGFDFSVPVSSPDQRFMGYAVAIVDEDEQILYSFAPRVPCTASESDPDVSFGKGVHTDIGILAAGSNAGLSVLDADLNRLESDAGTGYLYALDGKYYYFDRAYLSLLDERVKNDYENGMDVYLRLTAPADPSKGLPGILADSEERLMKLYAFADFLCSRYNTVSRGIVSGIIFGTAADRVEKSACALEQYTRIYADSLFAVHEAAAETHAVKLLVPLSDMLDDGNQVNSIYYSPRVFLTSLAKELTGRYAGSIPFTVMLESREGPDGTMKGNIGFDNPVELSVFLGSLHNSYSVVSDRFFCWWEPSATADRQLLTATYVRGYYSLACQPKADGFILSTALLSDVALTADLLEAVFYIDTQKTDSYGTVALEKLGQNNWLERIPSYAVGKIQRIQYRETNDPLMPPFRFIGNAYFWDFAGIGNDYGWSGGNGCISFMMENNEETNRALAAKMLPSASNDFRSELIYRFNRPKKLPGVDAFSFALRIDAPAGNYTVTVQIVTEGSVTQTKATIASGRLTVIYANTSELLEDDEIRCIRIFTAPANGSDEPYKLSVGSISVHSTTVSDKDLEELVRQSEQFDVRATASESDKMNVGWIYTIVLVFFVSVIIVMTLIFRSEDDRDKDNNRDREKE